MPVAQHESSFSELMNPETWVLVAFSAYFPLRSVQRHLVRTCQDPLLMQKDMQKGPLVDAKAP